MTEVLFREASIEDMPALAKIRGDDWQSEEYWNQRMTDYFNRTHHPQQALDERIIYVAVLDNAVVGFIAGHLTNRFGCEGELQWIDVLPTFRRNGIASQLTRLLATWFIKNRAYKICVDPGNELAKKFYINNGVGMLNQHWMFWENIRMIL